MSMDWGTLFWIIVVAIPFFSGIYFLTNLVEGRRLKPMNPNSSGLGESDKIVKLRTHFQSLKDKDEESQNTIRQIEHNCSSLRIENSSLRSEINNLQEQIKTLQGFKAKADDQDKAHARWLHEIQSKKESEEAKIRAQGKEQEIKQQEREHKLAREKQQKEFEEASRQAQAQEEIKRLQLQKENLELERQLRVKEFPLEAHIDVFMERFKTTKFNDIKGTFHTKIIALHKSLESQFETLGMIPPGKLSQAFDDVNLIDKIEAIMDLYGEKIRRVKSDNTLSEDEKQRKIEDWERIRDNHINHIGG